MEKITEHFTLEELTNTSRKVDNTPNEQAKENLTLLCASVLEPIRKKYGKPIIINSGYRSKALNKAVKGAKNSDHLFGCAADIRSKENTKEENKRLWDCIMSMVGKIQCRQIIDEKNYSWIHVSINHGGNSYKLNEILHLN